MGLQFVFNLFLSNLWIHLVLFVVLLNKIKKYNILLIINRKGKSLDRVFDFNVKWRSETFDERTVIIVQSVVVLNMNTEVLRIHDMNTFYKILDPKIQWQILYGNLGQVWPWAKLYGPNLPELAPDRLHVFPNITWHFLFRCRRRN